MYCDERWGGGEVEIFAIRQLSRAGWSFEGAFCEDGLVVTAQRVVYMYLAIVMVGVLEKLMMLMDEVSLKGPTEISVVAGKEGSTIKLDLIHHPFLYQRWCSITLANLLSRCTRLLLDLLCYN